MISMIMISFYHNLGYTVSLLNKVIRMPGVVQGHAISIHGMSYKSMYSKGSCYGIGIRTS